VPGGLHLPWRLIIRRFELSDKTYSKTNFQPATTRSVRRASALVLARHSRRAANDAVDTVSQNLFVPRLEKLLADGAIHEYEIDTEAIDNEAPGTFAVEIIAANGAGLDKFIAAVRDIMNSSPLAGPALGSSCWFPACLPQRASRGIGRVRHVRFEPPSRSSANLPLRHYGRFAHPSESPFHEADSTRSKT
jgi:hypothetical protein